MKNVSLKLTLISALFPSLVFGGDNSLYTNPITIHPCADPGVFFDDSSQEYYMSCTWGKLPIFKSKDLVSWSRTGTFVLPKGKTKWALSNRLSWAPEITNIKGRYISYFTQEDKSRAGAIGVAYTDVLNEDFKETDRPTMKWPFPGVIDPSYFRDPATDKHYLLAKFDGNTIGLPTEILITELNSDGTELLNNNHIQIKKGGNGIPLLIEGQDLIYYNGYYYLFYSAGDYASNYEVWVSRSRNVEGPYVGDRKILSGRVGSRFYAPGHGSVLKVDSEYFYLYHSFIRGVRNRRAMLDRIFWTDGWPIIHNGHPSESAQPTPNSPTKGIAKVYLQWNDPGIPAPIYSLDIESYENGGFKEIRACLDAGILRTSRHTIFDGYCLSKQRHVSLHPPNKVRVCAAPNGIWGPGVVCSPYSIVDKSSISLKLDIQRVQISWNNLGPEYVYSLDAKTRGLNLPMEPCIGPEVLSKQTSVIFNRRCSNGQLILLDSRSSIRVCASKNEWPHATCSNYTKISGPQSHIHLSLRPY